MNKDSWGAFLASLSQEEMDAVLEMQETLIALGAEQADLTAEVNHLQQEAITLVSMKVIYQHEMNSMVNSLNSMTNSLNQINSNLAHQQMQNQLNNIQQMQNLNRRR